jgi:hypothetical protein
LDYTYINAQHGAHEDRHFQSNSYRDWYTLENTNGQWNSFTQCALFQYRYFFDR